MNFMNFLKVNKEGALIGGGVGLAFYLYVKSKGISLMAVAAEKGLLDNIMSRSAPAAIADTKVLITCLLLGALIGIIIDAIIMPRK